MSELLIIGAGGHAKVVVEAAILQAKYKIVGLTDEAVAENSEILGYKVRRQMSDFGLRRGYFIVAIGDNATRKQRFEEMLALGWEPATIVHPTAVISRYCTIGEGSMICLRASICTEAKLGQNVILNSGGIVSHECSVGAHSHISVGVSLAGRTRVGEGVLMGVASCTIPGTRIGNWSTVGAGAAVIRDVSDQCTVVGVPAKPLQIGVVR